MQVTFWGVRGSLPCPGPDTARYGGNTSCVEVRGPDGTVLVLDAGSGIRQLGASLIGTTRRVDLLLTHLHLDHVQGLGFFAPLFHPGIELHIWGPASTTLPLRSRLTRYLSPPLFPVRLRDLPRDPVLHEVPATGVEVGGFRITAALVCHPGPTVGYRIETADAVLAYLPDHEPALGVLDFPLAPEWTSGAALAAGADLLIHDGQYTREEYSKYVSWGHSSLADAIAFGKLSGVRALAAFHHDPARTDDQLDRLIDATVAELRPPFAVTAAREGATYQLGT